MSQPKRFTYNSLPTGHTRLLKIVSPHPSLKCTLQQYATADMPEYMALSYTGGTEDPMESVHCDDQTLKVMPNLYAALSGISLKGEFSDRWLWIDALCINQNNAEEKAVEVKRMDVIYANTWSALVWLGPTADDSDAAMENLRGLTEVLTLVPKDSEDKENIQRRIPLIDDSSWNAIVKLYDRRWFLRL